MIATPEMSITFSPFSPYELLFFRSAVPSAAVIAIVNPIPKLMIIALSTPSQTIPIEIANKKTTMVPGQGTIPAPNISIKSVEFAVVLQLWHPQLLTWGAETLKRIVLIFGR